MTKTIIRAALVSAALLPTAALAEPGSDEFSARVSYADLDLTSPAGRATLDRRIDSTIQRLCGPSAFTSLTERRERRRCMRGPWRGAHPQIQVAVVQAQQGRVRELALASR